MRKLMQRLMTNHGSIATICLAIGFVLMSATPGMADCYRYWADVYGNGQWNWSGGSWATYEQAEVEARRACGVGTKVTYIGNLCTGQNWSYSCSGTVAVENVKGMWFQYYVPGQGWKNYNGQLAYTTRPLAAYTQDKANQWYNEIRSLLINNYRIPASQVDSYMRYGINSYSPNLYRFSGGLVYLK